MKHGFETKHSQVIFAGEASNFQTELSKRELSSQDNQLFTELAKALDGKEMGNEAFVDKFGCESGVQ